VGRDRRFDHLYDRQKQPVKQYILEQFAAELARELEAWPPAEVEWSSDALARRYAAGMEERPRQEVMRLALEAARLDLARDFDAAERLVGAARPGWTPADAAAGHLLVRFLTERCLGLKEHATGARLTRADLVAMLADVERRLFLGGEG
jgi:hypothetical protein